MQLTRLAQKLSENSIRKLLKLKRQHRKVKALKRTLAATLTKAARLAKRIATIEVGGQAKPRGRRLSAAARRRISRAQKRRWAARKGGKAAAAA